MGFTIATYVLYSIIIFIYLFAAKLLGNILNAKLPEKETILQRIKYQNLKMRDVFISPELEKEFMNAGYPFKLNAKRFQIWRFLIAFGLLGFGIYNFFYKPGLAPVIKVLYLACPLLFLTLITNPKRKTMKAIFQMYQNRNDYLKNQELFMVYSMITDELKDAGNQVINILDLIRKLRLYTPRIRGSINKGLRNNKSGIDVVMNIIGDDIGTEEAKEVCKIIAGMQNAGQQNVHELIAKREDTYIATLRANRQKRRTTLTNIVNPIVWLPLFVYIMNIMFVVMQMISSMSNSLTTLK
ncbi:hypothetical protein [Paenibacillus prosopidis]|uniref:Tight adherence protein C n=1 Tax=Paenibacillus prosopidis TaxID=630520 RepID=A0A368VJE8_9BACL|nr:hypothetical protein [Paenibacillus prosopidis]RCW41655.1 hypothetical protein DFP97_12291 [Paenibacillus prosopidis]